METTTHVHCFEQAGLGTAPFRYAGIVPQEISYGQRVIGNIDGCSVTTKAGGTCDYCGAYIVNMFRVESADGRQFKVGSDCILRTGDAGLIQRVNRDISTARKERERSRKESLRTDLRTWFETVRESLKEFPHPSTHFAESGRNLVDYVDWCRDNAGASGEIAAYSICRSRLGLK